uniref:helix-hairpin-helix domain-containing protein n=1 Tax=Ningiella ruwaisensis TaxID=2364274 RepID=UPI00109FD6E3|nr:helix-hairpin-helix domain-containing protein [Ningiella ruwaisensis]
MPFSEKEKSALLSVKGVGETVIKRFEEVGIDSLDKLARFEAAEVADLVASMLHSRCWKNTKALEAVQAAIDKARFCSQQKRMENI